MRISLLLALLFFLGNILPNAMASPYELSTGKEALYLGAGLGMGAIGYIQDQNKADPRLDDITSLNENSLSFIDRPYAGNWNKRYQTMSDVFLYSSALSPLPLIYFNKKDVFTIGVMYLETLSLTGGGTALAKASTTRYRPYNYEDSAPLSAKLDRESQRSFFSGHAALTASNLIFSATVYSDYYPNSKYKNYVWSAAITGLLIGGWLRVEGGKHFPTDVITGWVWGGLVGYLVPASHRKRNKFLVLPFMHQDQKGLSIVKRF